MRKRSKWMATLLVAVFAMAPLDASAQKAGETNQFPESWRANFMSGCTEGGGADATACGCVLRGFELSWPFWVAEEYDRAAATAEAERTQQQNELLAAGSRIVRMCVSNTNAY